MQCRMFTTILIVLVFSGLAARVNGDGGDDSNKFPDVDFFEKIHDDEVDDVASKQDMLDMDDNIVEDVDEFDSEQRPKRDAQPKPARRIISTSRRRYSRTINNNKNNVGNSTNPSKAATIAYTVLTGLLMLLLCALKWLEV